MKKQEEKLANKKLKNKSQQRFNDIKKENDVIDNSFSDAINGSNKKITNKTRKKLIILGVKVLICLILVYLVFGLVFGLKRMNSSYMTPNIKDGDLVLYYRFNKNYDVGDVVVASINGKDYILRIVATSGQNLDISKDLGLLVDGYLEPYPVYYQTKVYDNQKIKFPYNVPLNKYFVMSDYRSSKDDSRTFGAISKEDIKGKVISKIQVRGL